MSDYYLGDPCYVIPDAEWGDFCSIMRDDGEEFEYKGETCVVIGTGGDGDFGGLSVDAGIIGCIPVSLCDPVSLKSIVPSDARLVDSLVSLEEHNGFIVIDGEALGAFYCECRNCCGNNDPLAEHELDDCSSCGTPVKYDCQFEGFGGGYSYCSKDCAPKPECEICSVELDSDDIEYKVCEDCRLHSSCGCSKDEYEDDSPNCEDCQKDIDAKDK
tara:strand:- start:520 stop:1164 length:645 start_codon:yes stop_codon:yes gene_type:complete